MPSKIRGGTADKHLADMHIPRVSALGAGGAAAAAFDPSSVSGYTRDWNFADISKLYTDTAGTTPVTADADPIGAVLCSAGSTVKLAAPADASRGTYKTNIQNGLSVGRLDGSDDYWSNAAAITADASQTLIVVADKRGALGGTSQILFSIVGNASVFTNTTSGSATSINYFATEAVTVQQLTGTATAWNIYVFKYTSAASLSVYVNGGAPTTFNPRDEYSTTTALFIGAAVDGSADGDYDIGRFMVYSAALSNSDLDYLISGLGTLWGITVTPVS